MHRYAHVIVWGLSILIGVALTACPGNTRQVKSNVPKELKPLLAYIATQRQKIQSLEGSAKLRIYQTSKQRRTLRLNYQLQRPNRIHLQIVAAAMQPILIVTCDGREFAIHNLIQRQFIRGAADKLPQMLGDFLPTHIPLNQLIAALLGELPLLPAQTRSLQPGKSADLMTLLLKGPDHQQTVWLQVKDGYYLKTEVRSTKRPPLTLAYGTYRGNPPLPQRIQFIMPKRQQRIHWIFGDRTVNPKLSLSHFQQTAPKGIAVQIIR